MKRIGTLLLGLILVAIIAITVLLWPGVNALFGPRADPETIAASSLEGLKEQNRLVPFTARFVAVVTSTETRLGLEAKKTLILPGTVRYELDLAKLDADDLVWDAEKSTLTVTLPPLEIGGPEVDLKGLSEFRDGEIIMALTDAEARLDKANRDAAIKQILKQAREDTPIKLAQRAAKAAIESSFAMPLRAAGLDAKVIARFKQDVDK